MIDSRTDSELVAAHLRGDRSALAAIYDRYADPLYDTSAAMLSDRHEAGDVMHDVFLVAAERMDQLRDPSRLKAWLFAILRNEVYRRTKKRSRTRPTDFSAPGGLDVAAPTDAAAEGEQIAYQQLAEMVRGAAAGLDERDQLVLELSVRQGLTGADLADALGVSAEQSYVLVHRMRERVERSLGALTVARMGKKSCPELATVLSGWDGTFSVLIRKRVARHVDACATCEDTKKRYAVIPLLGAAPALAAPPELRESVLGLARRGTAGQGYGFDADGGFPSPLGRRRGPMLLLGAVAASLVVLLGGGLVVLSQANDENPLAAESEQATTTETVPSATTVETTVAPSATSDPTTTVTSTQISPSTTDALGDPSHAGVTNPPSTPAPTTVPETVATTAVATSAPTTTRPPTSTTRPPTNAPTTTVPPATPTTDVGGAGPTTPTTATTVAATTPPTAPPTTTPPTAPPTTTPPTTAAPTTTVPPRPGNLVLSTRTVDLGANLRLGALTLSNNGQQALNWSLQGGGAPFTPGTGSGTLTPGQSATVQFAMDRSGAEGDYSVTYNAVSSAQGGGAVQVRGRIERAPVVSPLRTISSLACTWTNSNMSVTVTDESGISSVTLSWSGPGNPGSTAMTLSGAGAGWIGSLGVDPVDGTWTWLVTATDARGNRGTLSGTTVVTNCNPPR